MYRVSIGGREGSLTTLEDCLVKVRDRSPLPIDDREPGGHRAVNIAHHQAGVNVTREQVQLSRKQVVRLFHR